MEGAEIVEVWFHDAISCVDMVPLGARRILGGDPQPRA